MRRAGVWVRISDLMIAAVLLTAAAEVARGHAILAVTLATFGIGVAAAAIMIEPQRPERPSPPSPPLRGRVGFPGQGGRVGFPG